MKKRLFLFTLLILSAIAISGCWDYVEYENMAQVVAIGVDFDKESQNTTLTIQYISTAKDGRSESSKPSSGNGGVVYSATDKTLYDALAKIQQVVMKRLFYGYLKVYILGEEAAKYNIMDQIELIDRTPAIRSTAYFAITPGKAENIISTIDPASKVPSSQKIQNLINLIQSTGAAYPVSIQDFTAMLAVGGLEATAPRVISTAHLSEKPEAKAGTQDGIRFNEENKGDLRVAGMAAFKGDKLEGWLDEKESMGFGWITGKKVLAYKHSELSGRVGSENVLYYRISKVKTKIKAELVNNQPVMHVNVAVTADLRKYYGNQGSDFFTPETKSLIEKELINGIRSDIEAALKKGQKELKSDIFGFGFAFFRKYPKLWQTEYERKWEVIFPEVPVSVDVKAKVINTGRSIRKLTIK